MFFTDEISKGGNFWGRIFGGRIFEEEFLEEGFLRKRGFFEEWRDFFGGDGFFGRRAEI